MLCGHSGYFVNSRITKKLNDSGPWWVQRGSGLLEVFKLVVCRICGE